MNNKNFERNTVSYFVFLNIINNISKIEKGSLEKICYIIENNDFHAFQTTFLKYYLNMFVNFFITLELCYFDKKLKSLNISYNNLIYFVKLKIIQINKLYNNL